MPGYTTTYYTFDEVLERLGIDETKLKRMVSEGEIRAFREGDLMKFRAGDVERLMQDRGLDPQQTLIVLPEPDPVDLPSIADEYQDDLDRLYQLSDEAEDEQETPPAEIRATGATGGWVAWAFMIVVIIVAIGTAIKVVTGALQ